MKKTQSAFIGIVVVIIVALVLIVGGLYYITEQKQKVVPNFETEVRDTTPTTTVDNIKTYTNSQFGVKFDYPTNTVRTTETNVFSKNSGRFENFDIFMTGGNFSFDILQDSNKMTPSFKTELDEVKSKEGISPLWNDMTTFSQLTINGNTAYKMNVYAKGYKDSDKCTYEKIVTKKDGYWYEFLARLCGKDTSESLKTFESVVNTMSFDR